MDKNGEGQYGRVHFICTRNLKHLFGEGILHLSLFLYNVPFAYQLKTIKKNIKQLDCELEISSAR